MDKENWKPGKTGGCVITDSRVDGFENQTGHQGEDATEYYGGTLIAESIWREKDVKLIAAAPDLLEACREALRMYEEIQPAGGWQGVYESIQSAVKKATE